MKVLLGLGFFLSCFFVADVLVISIMPELSPFITCKIALKSWAQCLSPACQVQFMFSLSIFHSSSFLHPLILASVLTYCSKSLALTKNTLLSLKPLAWLTQSGREPSTGGRLMWPLNPNNIFCAFKCFIFLFYHLKRLLIEVILTQTESCHETGLCQKAVLFYLPGTDVSKCTEGQARR